MIEQITTAAVVFAQDLDTRPSPSAAQLAALHGLTPREGQLAARLLAGDSLDEAARTLAITPGTARNYLASLFTKTRTRRQGELLALLLRSTPAYC